MFDAAALARLLREGRADDAAASVMADARGDAPWDAERFGAALRTLPGAESLLPALEAGLRDGGDASRRNAARTVLAALAASGGPPAAAERLAVLMGDDADADVRLLAATAAGESGNARLRMALEGALADPELNVAAAAADALGVLGDPRAVDALADALARADDAWGRVGLVVALGRLGDARAVPALAAAARDADPGVATAAAGALAEVGDPAGLDGLRAAVESADEGVRHAATVAAARLLGGGAAPPEWLRAAARDAEAQWARWFADEHDGCAALLLGAAGTRSAAARLVEAAADPDRAPLAAAGLALLPPAAALDALVPELARAVPEARRILAGAIPPPQGAADVARYLPLLGDDDGEVVSAVVDALARGPDGAVRPALEAALGDPPARAGAAAALGRLPGGAAGRLRPLLADADPAVRAAAAEGLARSAAPGIEGALVAALAAETDAGARCALIAALGRAGGAEAVAALDPLARGGEPSERFAAVRALGRAGGEAVLPPLLAALADDDQGLQAAALRALGETGDPGGADAVAARLDAADRDLRREAARALERIAPPAATERLLAALADRDWRVRLAAARTLARAGVPAAAAALAAAGRSDPDPLVRRAAAGAAGAE